MPEFGKLRVSYEYVNKREYTDTCIDMYGCTRILKWKSLKLSSGEVYVNRWKGRDGDGKRRKRKEKREQRTQAFRVKEGEKNGCIATGWKGSVFTRLVGVDGTRVSAERSSIEVED